MFIPAGRQLVTRIGSGECYKTNKAEYDVENENKPPAYHDRLGRLVSDAESDQAGNGDQTEDCRSCCSPEDSDDSEQHGRGCHRDEQLLHRVANSDRLSLRSFWCTED